MNTVDTLEIKQFSKDSAHWWDENGPFKPLHHLNPVRLNYIKQQICKHFGRDFEDLKALKGLSILDVGCGGGLVCEPIARLGAKVTGIDADENAIDVAQNHAQAMGLAIDYACLSTSEILQKPKNKKTFDIVLALEILEHVADVDKFVEECINLCKPNGLVIFSTLNRTPKSYALGIVAAEYILRWVPQGTHSWKKFIKPHELARVVRKNNAKIHDITGLVFNPFKNEFALSKTDMDVNYFMTVLK